MARLTTNPTLNRWLTDSSINYFVHLLNAKDTHIHKNARTVKFIDSNSTCTLLAFDLKLQLSSKRRARLRKKYIAASATNTDPINKIFMVVGDGVHYFVVMLTLHERIYKIRTIDSMNVCRNDAATKLKNVFNKLLQYQPTSAAPAANSNTDCNSNGLV